MANRTFLMINLSGDPNQEYTSESVVVGSSYFYPVLWWSLFSEVDIVLRTEEWEDDDDNPLSVSFPCPLVSLEIARERAKKRQSLFFSYFPPSVELIYQQWLVLLDEIQAPFLQMHTGEIWAMSEPEQANIEIATFVRAFDEGHLRNWQDLLAHVGIKLDPQTRALSYIKSEFKDDQIVSHQLSEKEIAEVAKYRLRGYSWERPVPWGRD